MPLTLNNTNTLTADTIIVGGTELSLIYAKKSEIGNNAQITTNTDDIAILNTKQLQNFNSITAINTDLTNNYQTNTQLASNFYNKTEIDTTLTNYYTSAQIDTNLSTNYQNNTLLTTNFYNKTEIDTNLSTNYQTNTQLGTNFYNKGEVDTLIAGAGGGGGYTDTEIDNLLDLRVPKSDFANRFSTFPIIDCSAPTIIHSGLTLNNETINIAPTTGLLFSNQTGGGDKIIGVFKNATSYITLQGNKIISNATSDDSVVDLNLNPSGNINMNNDLAVNNVNVTTNLTIGGGIDITNNLTVKGDIELTNSNTSIERYTNATKSNISMDLSINETANAIRLINGTNDDTDTNTYIECNNTTGGTTLFKPTYFKENIFYETDNFNISNNSGLTIYKPTTDASNVVAIANNSGKLRFRGFSIDAYNTNDSSQQLFLNMNNSNAVRCNKLGIGANAVVDVLNVNGGNSNFSSTVRFNGATTFNNEILIWNNSKIYRRADANNSLNLITNDETNFSFQANRATDPTTGTIALQLTDTNGITLNRAVVNNQTFNSIGNITAEANLNVWGEILFQHSSGIKETLNGSDYDLDVRNGDTDRAINFIVGTVGSTPQVKLTNANVNLLGHLDFTHQTVSTSERVKIDNPDADGLIFLSINGANICEISSTGLHVNGTATETSDERLKENVKEVSSKTCYDIVKYIKPKEFNFKGKEEREIGFIAQDIPNSKMPKHWSKMVMKDSDDDYLRLNYIKMNVVLWGCVQHLMKEVDDLRKEVNKIKGEESPKAKAKAKAKTKN